MAEGRVIPQRPRERRYNERRAHASTPLHGAPGNARLRHAHASSAGNTGRKAGQAAKDIIEIGEKLIEVKDRLGHGKFGGWLAKEFDWTPMTATRFMNVAERFKDNNLLDFAFAPSALYLLSAPSTPEPARMEALQRAEAGEQITYSAARDIVGRQAASSRTDVVRGR